MTLTDVVGFSLIALAFFALLILIVIIIKNFEITISEKKDLDGDNTKTVNTTAS